MLELSRAARAWALSAASAAALLAGVASAGAATTPRILFNNATVDGGAFPYKGTGGAISGAHIQRGAALGSGTALNDGVALICEDCTLSFVRGANGFETPILTFSPAGSLAVTGAAKDSVSAIANGTLRGSVFNDTMFASKAGNAHINVSAHMDVTINNALAAFYGTSTQGLAVTTRINALAGPVDVATSAFQGTATDADITYLSAPPVPATLPLLLSAMAGIAMIGRRHDPASA